MRASIVAITIALGIVYGWIILQLHSMPREISLMIREHVLSNDRRQTMQTLTSTWKSQGITHTVSTTREQDEADEVFVARHAALVSAMREQYPPDTE